MINKKALVIFIVMIFSVFTVFGKETKKSSKAKQKEQKQKIEQVEQIKQVEQSSKENKKLSKAKQKKADKKKKEEQKKLEKEAAKKAKEEEAPVKVIAMVSDEGVFSRKNVVKKVDNIKMLLKGNIGSFQLYAVDNQGNEIPVLAGYDEFTSSFLSLRVDKKEYHLSDKIGIIIGAREKENGGQLVYVVQDVARVLVDFTCVPATSEYSANVLRVDISVENKGKEVKNFGIKNVLDTYLGEHEGCHFRAGNGIIHNTEIQYRKMSRVKWIYSGNSKAGMQVLLQGADIISPEVLSLSNKDVLSLPAWVPDLVEGRPFDSVFSYNNSAIGMNWENLRIKPNEEKKITYYIVFTTKNQDLIGDEFLKFFGQEGGYNPDAVEKVSTGERKISDWIDDDDIATNVKQSKPKKDVEVISSIEKPEVNETQNVEFDVNSIEKEKLNYEYIQQLIDKINKLEADDSEINKNELLMLNTELDVILEKLRQ